MKLKVTNVKYRPTFKGVSYRCETNYSGLFICNNGQGGATYLEGNPNGVPKTELNLDEDQLENLINEYERQPTSDMILGGKN